MAYTEVCTWEEGSKGYLRKVCKKVWVPDKPKDAQPKAPTPKPPAPTPKPAAPKPSLPPVAPTPPQMSVANRAELARRRSEILAQQRRAAAARLAAERRKAWLRLQETWKEKQQRIVNQQAQSAADKERTSNAARLERDDERIATTTGDAAYDRRLADMNEQVTVGDVRRRRMMQQAESEGYEAVFKQIQRQQEASGGRYVDTTMFEYLTKKVQEESVEAQQTFVPLYQQAETLFNSAVAAEEGENFDQAAKLWERAAALVNSPEYAEAYEAYIRWFGEGREEGEIHRLARIQNEIAQARDEWLTSVIFGANPNSHTSMNQARERAQEALTIRSGGGQYMIDDPSREAESQIVTRGLQNYLNQLDANEQARYHERYRRTFTGPQPEWVETHRGQRVTAMHDGEQQKTMARVVHYATAVLGEDGYRSLERQMRGRNGQLRGIATRKLLAAAREGYIKENGEQLPRLQNAADPAARAFWRSVEQWDNLAYEAVMGEGRPDGFEGFMLSTMDTPILGPALQLASGFAASIGIVGRESVRRTTGGGRLAGRDYQAGFVGDIFGRFNSGRGAVPGISGLAAGITNIFTSEDPITPAWTTPQVVGEDGVSRDITDVNEWGVSLDPEIRRQNQAAWDDFIDIFHNPELDFWTKLQAWNDYGSGLQVGNSGILLEAVYDPLNFFPAAKFLRAGRLAGATSAGTRGFRRAVEFGEDFWRYSMPRKWGGLDPDLVIEMERRRNIARITNENPNTLFALTQEQMTEYAQRALLDLEARNPRRASALQRLFEADPVRSQQLAAAVADEFAKHGDNVNPLEYNRLLARAEEATKRAELHASAAARRIDAANKLEEGVRALSDLELERRAKHGEFSSPHGKETRGVEVEMAEGYKTTSPRDPNVKVAEAEFTSADGITYRTRGGTRKGSSELTRQQLQQRYATAVEVETKLAGRVQRTLKTLNESRDQATRARAYASLEDAVRKLDEYQTKIVDGPEGREYAYGRVETAKMALDEYDAKYRSLKPDKDGRIPAAGLLDLQGARLDRAMAYARSEVRRLRQDLRLAPPGLARSKVLGRLQRAELALQHTKLMRRLYSQNTRALQRRLRRYGDRLKDAIAPERVAYYAEDTDQIVAGVSRDLRVRALESEIVDSPASQRVALTRKFMRFGTRWVDAYRRQFDFFDDMIENFGDDLTPLMLYSRMRSLKVRRHRPGPESGARLSRKPSSKGRILTEKQTRLYDMLEAYVHTQLARQIEHQAPFIRATALVELPWLREATQFLGDRIDPIALYNYLARQNIKGFDARTRKFFAQLESFIRDELRKSLDGVNYEQVARDTTRLAELKRQMSALRRVRNRAERVLTRPPKKRATRGGPGPEFRPGARLPVKTDFKALMDPKNPDGWDAVDVWGIRPENIPGLDANWVEELIKESRTETFDIHRWVDVTPEGWEAGTLKQLKPAQIRRIVQGRLDAEIERLRARWKETGQPPLINVVKRGVRPDGGPAWSPRHLSDLAAALLLAPHMQRLPVRMWRESGKIVPLKRPVLSKASSKMTRNSDQATKAIKYATDGLVDRQREVDEITARLTWIEENMPRYDRPMLRQMTQDYIDLRRSADPILDDWDKLVAINNEVGSNIEKVRGWKAKGQIRQSAGRLNDDPPQGNARVNRGKRDNDIAEVMAKLAALDKHGITADGYDELRAATRDIQLREGRSLNLLEQSKRGPGKQPEKYNQLRDLARQSEVVRNAEELSANPAALLLDDDSFVALYEERFILDDLGFRDPQPRKMTRYQHDTIRAMYEKRAGAALEDNAAAARHLQKYDIPFGNRRAMREWLVERGIWAPRTREQVAADATPWTIGQERRFWEHRYGYTPPWADPEVLRAIAHNKDQWDAAMRGWGVLDTDFEKLMVVGDLKPEQIREGIVWGAEGVKKARSYAELRAWVIDRFEEVASTDGTNLIAFPWLMNPLADEYAAWQRTMFKRGFKQPSLTGDEFKWIDPGLIREEQVDGLADAVTEAVRKRMATWKTDGRLDDLSILPEQFNAFVYDVVDYLLAEKSWRSFWQRAPLLGRITGLIGTFFRAFIVYTAAFPIVNMIDAYGPRRVLLAITKNGFRPITDDIPDWIRETVQSLESLGLDYSATFYIKSRHGFVNMRDADLKPSTRAREFLRGVQETPLLLSKNAEDALRLDFAHNQIANEYRRLLRMGLAEDAARVQSMAAAKTIMNTLFTSLDNAPWWAKVINDLVPFFHYNFTLKKLTLGLVAEHPWLLTQAERLAEALNEWNRQQWEAEHPGTEMPWEMEDKVTIKIGDTEYLLDLSAFSDWTRTFDMFHESKTPMDIFTEFFRVPHPSQAIFLAWAFGFNEGKTPWGTEARFRDLSVWFEGLYQLFGQEGGFDPANPDSKDIIQAMSQMLFYQAFGRIDPLRVKVQTFYMLRDNNRQLAYDWLEQNGDVKLWLQMHTSGRFDPLDASYRHSWFQGQTDDNVQAFQAARDEYEQIVQSYDLKLNEFYLTPWSAEYAALKRERRLTLAQFLHDNPILGEVWGFHMTRREWAEVMGDWEVDQLMDEFFAMSDTRPVESSFGSELEYAQALNAWVDARTAWLEAHPKVQDRLRYARNAVEQAWFDHEAHWAEILDFTADLKIRRLQEEAKGAAADRDLINLLHDLTNDSYAVLNAESYQNFYDQLDAEVKAQRSRSPRWQLGSSIAARAGRLTRAVLMPGRADFFYERANPQEQAEIRQDEKYFRDIGAFMEGLDDPKKFWSELEANPGLRDEYLRRNPDKKVDYEYAMAIAAVFAKGGYKKFWDNLVAQPDLLQQYLERGGLDAQQRYQKYLDGRRYYNEITALFDRSNGGRDFYALLSENPWLEEQYYARNPEKRGNSRYAQEMQALIAASTDGASFYRGLEANPWLKAQYFARNPDKAASYEAGQAYFNTMKRWVNALEAGNTALAQRIWDSMPAWMKERYYAGGSNRQGGARGQEYFNAMGEWIKLLKAKDYVKAKEYFDSLPDWMREKYFEKHPDQRARNELDNQALIDGARYFLASGEDRVRELQNNPALARWLKEHSGNEGAYRGLIVAIYRSLPSGDAWLKRTFRERYPEIFGQEAAGERRLRSVARKLAENPDMEPYYQKQLALQRRLYQDQLRRSGAPPRPLTMERKRRLAQRRRRRAARMASHYSKHREVRLRLN